MVEPVNITMVTYNRLDFTRQSIASIAKTAGYPYRLTVVDNASHDGTVPLLGELDSQGIVDHLILNERNRGVAFAANQGWAAGGKAHYLKIDNDIVFLKDGWLASLVEACDRLPDVGAVGFSFEANSYPAETIVGLRLRPKQGNIGGACLMIPERVHLPVRGGRLRHVRPAPAARAAFLLHGGRGRWPPPSRGQGEPVRSNHHEQCVR
jgi:glycosyltransferase involved in cell wall biosynthesis